MSSRAAAAGDLARQAGGERGEALGVLRQQGLVDPRVVVHPVHVGHGGERPEVAVALGVAGQEDQVVGDPLAAVGAPLGTGDVGLEPDDRLDARFLGLLVEIDGSEHVAVVGHRHGFHARGGQPLHQILHADRPIEERVERVQMEVNEVGHAVLLLPMGAWKSTAPRSWGGRSTSSRQTP